MGQESSLGAVDESGTLKQCGSEEESGTEKPCGALD